MEGDGMNKYLLIICVFVLTACGSGQGQPTNAVQSPSVNTIVEVFASDTPVPTATIDYQATIALVQQEAQIAQQEANQAQAQADAAKRLMVDATVTHEAVMLIAAQMTQSSEVLSAQGTQAAINATSSAYPTSIPLTATMQHVNNSVMQTQQAGNDPKFIQEQANAEAYAENAGMLMTVEIGMKWAMALFIVAMGAALVIFIMRYEPNRVIEEQGVESIKPIPMAFDKDNSRNSLRSELFCTNEQIVELADGIINRNMTLAFNPWQSANVHKNLKEIRDYFQEHKFAKVVPGKGGELIITAEGEEFLMACLNLKEPPLPHVCIIPSPMNGNVAKLAPVI
jgi:biopolymer transport protein ExbD